MLGSPCCPSSHSKAGPTPAMRACKASAHQTAAEPLLSSEGRNGWQTPPSFFLGLASLWGCFEDEGRYAHTLSLQHVVSILDLGFFRQGQRPAVKQLNNLGLHFLRHPVPQVLRGKRKWENLITAVQRQRPWESSLHSSDRLAPVSRPTPNQRC